MKCFLQIVPQAKLPLAKRWVKQKKPHTSNKLSCSNRLLNKAACPWNVKEQEARQLKGFMCLCFLFLFRNIFAIGSYAAFSLILCLTRTRMISMHLLKL